MTRDLHTNTEQQAAAFDRAQTLDYDTRDRDLPGPVPGHECTSPNPATCVVCVLDAVVADTKAARELDRWTE